jgi:hypothetical protein
MMGRQKLDRSQLFYLFNLEARIPARHLLRPADLRPMSAMPPVTSKLPRRHVRSRWAKRRHPRAFSDHGSCSKQVLLQHLEHEPVALCRVMVVALDKEALVPVRVGARFGEERRACIDERFAIGRAELPP